MLTAPFYSEAYNKITIELPAVILEDTSEGFILIEATEVTEAGGGLLDDTEAVGGLLEAEEVLITEADELGLVLPTLSSTK